MPEQVFMCYAREDEDFVLRLASALMKQGIPVWIDQWDIPGGADWDMEVQEALARSSHLVVVLSPASMESQEVREEWRLGLDEDIPIIPVLYQQCSIERGLGSYEYIDFTSRSPSDPTGVAEIVRALGLGWWKAACEAAVRTAGVAAEPERLAVEAQTEVASEPAAQEGREEPATSLGQIFISHNTEQDGEFAQRLACDLTALGVRVWIAPESINPGENWATAIQRGLEESTHVLVVCTPEGMDSRWVDLEISSAIALERQGLLAVIPLDVRACRVPLFLQNYQMVSFRQDYDTALQRLASRLE